MRGSIQKRKGARGVSYLVRVDLAPDPVTGERRQASKSYDTRKEAERERSKWLVEIERGTAVETTKQTVAEFLRHWLETVAKPKVRPTTLEDYRATIENHIIPALGSIQIQKLTPSQVQSFYAAKRDEFADGSKGRNAGNGARTVQLCHRRLSQALDQGVKWGTVARNVCDAVDSPTAPPKRAATWSVADVKRFLKAAESDKLNALWLAALTTGARQGELLALRWSDLDAVAETLTVAQSLAVLDKKVIIQMPKTATSNRTIQIDPTLIAALNAHRETQEAERAAFFRARRKIGEPPELTEAKWSENGDLIFRSSTGTALHPSNVLRRFYALRKTAGVPDVTFHGMRHTNASMLIASGLDIPRVSKRLGHAKSSTTMDTYAHVVPGSYDRAVSMLTDLLFSDEEPELKALRA